MYKREELINDATKETNFSTNEIVNLRDKFIERYCEFKNWKKSDLTVEQVSEIHSHKEWKNPGIMKS